MFLRPAVALLTPLLLAACAPMTTYPPGAASYAQAPLQQAATCGIQGYPLQPGSAVVTATLCQRDRPFMGFGISPVPIVRASVLSPPCQGQLLRSNRPLGFRYVPRPGYLGSDSYVIQGCTASGQCIPQGVAVTIAR